MRNRISARGLALCHRYLLIESVLVRREVRNLTVMGMDPGQPPDQAALLQLQFRQPFLSLQEALG